MTSIHLTITGAHVLAEVNGILTSGMVGIPVTIEYDSIWQGLTKNLVCRCGRPYCPPDKAATWIIPEIETSATVAPEAMQAEQNLYLGVEGYSSSGDLVIPTKWVDCGLILPGAQTVAAQSAEPTQPIWAQLKSDIAQLQQSAMTNQQVETIVSARLQSGLADISRKADNAVLITPQQLNVAKQAQARTNIGAREDIPDHIKAAANQVARAVQSRQHANTISFMVCADLHYTDPNNAYPNTYSVYQKEAMTHLGQAMELIRERVPIDFTAMLGDMFWDSRETAAEALTGIRFVNSCLYAGSAGIPNFRTRGNHDNGPGINANFPDSRIFASIGIFNNGAVYGNRTAGYCYRDFEEHKLRVVCLNSSEAGGCQFSAEQVAWLAKTLDLSEKGDDWHSILLSHHPLDWGLNGGVSPIAAVNNASGIICAIHGHIHNFKVGTITGTSVTRISVPNACYGRENQYGTAYGVDWGEDTAYPKVPGTAADTSFCIFTIDFDSKIIYADHYGAGYSRAVPYEHTVTYSVSNVLSHVTSGNAQSTIEAGNAYSAVLTADSGYEISTVSVTMGGADITSVAYSSGQIQIDAVTGDIVITAAATEIPAVNDANLVPTATAEWNGTAIYNGTGYKDGAYVSSNNSFGTAEGYVAVGFLLLNKTDVIYIKGAELAAEDKVRIYSTTMEGVTKFCCKGTALNDGTWTCTSGTNRFTVEQLGDLYYKITPIQSAVDVTMYYRISLKGTGAGLVITHNEPIE